MSERREPHRKRGRKPRKMRSNSGKERITRRDKKIWEENLHK